MNNLKKTTSKKNIIKSIERNMVEYNYLFINENGFIEIKDGASIIYTGTPLFNKIILVDKIAESIVKDIVVDTNAKLKELNIQEALWIILPSTKTSNLYQFLTKYNFQYVNFWYGMAIDLSQMSNNNKVNINTNFEIVNVKNNSELEIWTNIAFNSYELLPEYREAVKKILHNMVFISEKKYSYYIGYVDGKPVSSLLSFTSSDGVVGIYWVGTIEEERKKGYGTAITYLSLKSIYENGSKIAILQATAEGKGIYKKLGFKEYCKIDFFYWLPQEDYIC